MIQTGWQIVRSGLAFTLAGWSLLVFWPTEKLFFFPFAVGATEFGHWLAIPALGLALLAGHGSRGSWVVTLLLAAAGLIFLWPAIQAFRFAAGVPEQVRKAFPSRVPDASPLSFGKLWLGTKVAGIKPEKMVYAENGGKPLNLYFYHPVSRRAAPCIIVLHTGGWFSGTPLEFEKMSSWLAEKGYAVAAIDYRFAPQHPWPAQREDVRAALQFLTQRAATLGVDATQFVLFGRSAGAQIAEATAFGEKAANLRGCIAFYGPADLAFAYKYARSDDILNSLKLVKDYMGGPPEVAAENYDSASAIRHAAADSPPTLLIHGTPDKLVWVKQSQRFAKVLHEQKVRHLFLELPWATHAFDYNFDGPGGQISRYAVERFLANVTQR